MLGEDINYQNVLAEGLSKLHPRLLTRKTKKCFVYLS